MLTQEACRGITGRAVVHVRQTLEPRDLRDVLEGGVAEHDRIEVGQRRRSGKVRHGGIGNARTAERKTPQTSQTGDRRKADGRHLPADARRQPLEGRALAQRDESGVAGHGILAVQRVESRNRRDGCEDLVAGKRAVKVELLQRRHLAQVRHPSHGAVRGRMRTWRSSATTPFRAPRLASAPSVSMRAELTERNASGLRTARARESRAARRAGIGQPGADENARQRPLAGERGNRPIAGLGPLRLTRPAGGVDEAAPPYDR